MPRAADECRGVRHALEVVRNDSSMHARCLQVLCPQVPDGTRIVVNLSGRGDKDVQAVANILDAHV